MTELDSVQQQRSREIYSSKSSVFAVPSRLQPSAKLIISLPKLINFYLFALIAFFWSCTIVLASLRGGFAASRILIANLAETNGSGVSYRSGRRK
jgi:hypothetical protein